MSFSFRNCTKASLVKGRGTAEGGGEILTNGNFLFNGIPHPASPGAPLPPLSLRDISP